MVSQSLVVMVSTVMGWRSRFCWNQMLWSQVMSRS